MKKNTLLAFIGGALVGAAAALLLAPESGADTRKKIRNLVEKGEEEVEELAEEIAKRAKAAARKVSRKKPVVEPEAAE